MNPNAIITKRKVKLNWQSKKKKTMIPKILNSKEKKSIFFIGEVIIILVSLNVFVNHAIDERFIRNVNHYVFYAICLAVYILIAYILDFYNIEKSLKLRTSFSQATVVSFLFVFTIFFSTVLILDASFWRWPLIVFLVLTPLEVVLWRVFLTNIFKFIPTTKNVIYIYDNKTESELKNHIGIINGKGVKTFYKVKVTYSLDKNNFHENSAIIPAIQKIDGWILNVAGYSHLPRDLEKILLNSILNGKEVISYTSFYESTYEALPIDSRSDSFYEILQLQNRRIRYLNRIFTFFLNFSLCLVLGLILAIITPFVFVLNFFLNKGPLFYTQKRVGQYGKEFKIYKFRSMVVDAEKTGAKMASKNDARITSFGKVLRMFRIDELPQILSVISGKMQFIGPRPERKFFVDKLNEITPFYGVRHVLKPGITGWAQVKYKYGENLEDSIKKLEYDLYYLKNRSITLDLRIIFKTVTTVLFSRGI